jgi:hypothetical protein
VDFIVQAGSGTGTPIHIPGVDFIVQDGETPTSTANAYISVAEFQEYHANRGNTYSATESEIEVAIIQATDYADARWTYAGMKWYMDQSTECPRQNVYDPNNGGFWVTGIPATMKQAIAEYAFIALTSTLMPNPTRDDSGKKLSGFTKKVDVLTTSRQFLGGGHYEWPQYPLADRMMRRSGLIANTGGELVRG